MRTRSWLFLALVFVLGCDRPSPPELGTLGGKKVAYLAAPDPTYRLSARDRELLNLLFDVDVLEQLAAWLPARERELFVKGLTDLMTPREGNLISVSAIHVETDNPTIKDLARRAVRYPSVDETTNTPKK